MRSQKGTDLEFGSRMKLQKEPGFREFLKANQTIKRNLDF